MNTRTALLAASVAANLGLAAILLFQPSRERPAMGVRVTPDSSWALLQPAADGDSAAFAAKLRGAGLPEHIVSALVAADARERTRLRREAADLAGAEGGAPPPSADLAGRGESLATTRSRFAGPLNRTLDFIDPSRRERARTIARDYEEMIGDIRRGGVMLTESDKQMLAALEGERHRELAGVLSPRELADFEMLQSPLYKRLAYETNEFNPSLEEFRAIYALTKEYSDRFGVPALGALPPRREEWNAARQLRKQTDEALLRQLGADRFAAYDRSRSFEYRELAKLGRRLEIPEAQTVEVFSMRDYVSTESTRIAGDSALSPQEKCAALQTLAKAVRGEIRQRLGDEGGAAYLRFADKWLSQVESGHSVVFEINSAHYRRVRGLPRAMPPPSGG